MVFIRTDANDMIATGHVMRCLTIADELKALGEEIVFLVSGEESTALLEGRYAFINLHSDWQHPEQADEIRTVRELCEKETVQRNRKPVLFMDSYSIGSDYTRKLADCAFTVLIDDLFADFFDVDMLVNYTLYCDRFDYAGRYQNTRTRLLLGGQYVPLRREFYSQEFYSQEFYSQEFHSQEFYSQEVHSQEVYTSEDYFVKDAVSGGDAHRSSRCQNEADGRTHILVICGGGDIHNVMGAILARAVEDSQLASFAYEVVAGAYNPNKQALFALQEKYPMIHVHDNVTDMAGLMRGCDIAVSAASTVLYECCAMQLPTVFFCVADNQRYDRECFGRDNVMLYAGDVQADKTGTVGRICSLVSMLAADTALQQQMKEAMHHLVDGRGAQRIASQIVKYGSKLL